MEVAPPLEAPRANRVRHKDLEISPSLLAEGLPLNTMADRLASSHAREVELE
jgi:hypothetical protein